MVLDPNRADTNANTNAITKKKVKNEDLVSPKSLLQIFTRSRT